jgi:hypothetical protein
LAIALDPLADRAEPDLIEVIVRTTRGIEAVERDPLSARVWIFANGTVDPEALCDALSVWGYGAYVLDNQITTPV